MAQPPTATAKPVLDSSEDAIAKRLGEAFGIESETARWFFSPDWDGKGLTLEVEKEFLEKAEKAEAELAKTRAALDLMGKAHALLETLSESADKPPRSPR